MTGACEEFASWASGAHLRILSETRPKIVDRLTFVLFGEKKRMPGSYLKRSDRFEKDQIDRQIDRIDLKKIGYI